MKEHGLPRNRAVILLLEKALGGIEEGGMHKRDSPEKIWDTPPQPDEPGLLERLTALEMALAALQHDRQPPTPQPAGTLDESRHYLGPLCEKGHEWENTGQSRRSRRNNSCMACEAEAARERRARNKTRAGV